MNWRCSWCGEPSHAPAVDEMVTCPRCGAQGVTSDSVPDTVEPRGKNGNAAWKALSDKPRCRAELLMGNSAFMERVGRARAQYRAAMRPIKAEYGAAVYQTVLELEHPAPKISRRSVRPAAGTASAVAVSAGCCAGQRTGQPRRRDRESSTRPARPETLKPGDKFTMAVQYGGPKLRIGDTVQIRQAGKFELVDGSAEYVAPQDFLFTIRTEEDLEACNARP